jgi:hypothetical protein
METASARARTALRRTVLAMAAIGACASSSAALPDFTFDPAAVGLAGTSFTADNLLISDYASITNTATGFTESGFLAITNAQLGAATFQPTGLTSAYGLYISFSGTGTNTFSSGGFNGGTYDSLSYTLYGYNGPATFTPTSAPAPAVTFSIASGAEGFFTSPTSFYTLAQSAFNNTLSEIVTTSTGFVVTQGGGSVNFIAAAPVPEPETYALLLAGLVTVCFVARRRNNAR